MERINHLGRYLPSGEALFLAVFFPLKGELSGQDIGGIGHRMNMPFERRVWWNRNLENRKLRPVRRVGGIRLTIPRRTALQQGFRLNCRPILTNHGALLQEYES